MRELDSLAAGEVRQLEDRLGLTPKSMRLMLWTIVGDLPKEREAQERREGEGAKGGSNVTDIRAAIRPVADEG